MFGWFKDKRPAWIQEDERKFIEAVNTLRTLQATPQCGVRIDPEEIREQIIESRTQRKWLVRK